MSTKLQIDFIDFDRSIGTEDRFNLRKWFELVVAKLNQSNSTIWHEVVEQDLLFTGLLEETLDGEGFIRYLKDQHEKGDFTLRYLKLKATRAQDFFRITGEMEASSDGVLVCLGDIKIEIVKREDETFKLLKQELDPKFRVQ